MAEDYGKVYPFDKYNQKLVANVHPTDWKNPEPQGRYNLIVLGAGTAGLVTAIGAAALGAKVALLERHLFGGDCLNVGCVPSKAIIRSGRMAADIRHAKYFGINLASEPEVDFAGVMERMRSLRARISPNDAVARYRNLGIDVFLGEGHFMGRDMIEVAGKHLQFKRAVIATGARAISPNIPGIAEAGFLTNETIFSLTNRPQRLAIIGGGPIGCELAQTFCRLGCQVILLHNKSHILDREDAAAAEIVQQVFEQEGIRLVLNSKIKLVKKRGEKKYLLVEQDHKTEELMVDEILVGAGRAPNVKELKLEAVKVKYDPFRGVIVNDYLQTTNPMIYAAGDCCMAYKFTHAASAAAKLVVQNALFRGKKRLSALTIPWCTYTDPEIAHVGMYAADARHKGIPMNTFVRELKDVDRAVLDGEDLGLVKIHTKKGTDQILGATIVARHAGDMISEISVAMAGKIGLAALYNVIHPYPTQAEAIKQTAGAYMRTRLTPLVKALFQKWLTWTR